MSKLTLMILAFVSSNAIFVASETCSASADCDEDRNCCYNGRCTTNRLRCFLRRINSCYADWECANSGCCVGWACYKEYSWLCMNKCTEDDDCYSGCCKNNQCQATKSECDTHKSCYWNLQCNSGCCLNGKCQETYEACSSTTTTAAPYTSDNCYFDCSDYGECCVDGKCQYCHQPTTYPWFRPKTTRGKSIFIFTLMLR